MHKILRTLLDKIIAFISHRIFIFSTGLILGIAVSYGATLLPWNLSDFFPAEEEPVIVEQPEFKLPPIDLPMNPRIQARIDFYLKPARRKDLLETYARAGKYLPMISAIFEEYNLPQQLTLLPILESRFLPHSRSHVGAVGLWQFMPATANEYGLKNNRWVDERRDPEKSTIIAAEYLQYLYEKFKDWELALASYNGGFAKIRRAMRRDKATDFWGLRHIPRETRNFVPNFYAIVHIISHPEKYGIQLPKQNKPIDYETIELEATFSIEQLAKLANVSTKTIKRYNPALITNIAPSGSYLIRVPIGVKAQFLEQYKENPLDQVEITYATYRVRRGDTLSKIAKAFNTTTRAIMADNNLRSSRWIKTGMKLKLATITVTKATDVEKNPDPETIAAAPDSTDKNKVKFIYRVERNGMALNTLARYYSVSADELKKWNPWTQGDRLQYGEELSIFKSMENMSVHKTRRGDSLWKLARRYKTSVSNIKRWNQLVSSRIHPGDNLIVTLN